MSVWDLSPLFKDKTILKTFIQSNFEKCLAFEKKYQKQLKTLKKEQFESVMREYEECCEEISRIMTYAFLRFASNTKEGAFYAECELEVNKSQEHLLFFEVEFNKLPKTLQKSFIQKSGKYRYYLELLAKNAKHQLTLPEEKILLKTQPVGVDSFKRLFDEHLSTLKFSFEGKEMSEEEILSLLYDKNRDTRQKAAKSLSEVLRKNLNLLAFIYNVVRKDLKITAELRGYKNL